MTQRINAMIHQTIFDFLFTLSSRAVYPCPATLLATVTAPSTYGHIGIGPNPA